MDLTRELYRKIQYNILKLVDSGDVTKLHDYIENKGIDIFYNPERTAREWKTEVMMLMHAVHNDDYEMCEYLLKIGCKPTAGSNDLGVTNMHMVKSVKMYKLFEKYDDSVYKVTLSSKSAYFGFPQDIFSTWCCESPFELTEDLKKEIKEILERQTPNFKDNPIYLQRACKYKNEPYIRFLMELNVIKSKDPDKKRELHEYLEGDIREEVKNYKQMTMIKKARF